MADHTSPPTPPSTPPETFSDIFDSRSPSPSTSRPSSPSHLPPDLTRLRITHNTEGYRAGIAASKPLHIQAGFDESYPLGARIGLKLGWVLGVLTGLEQTFPEDVELKAVKRRAERELTLQEVFGEKWWDGRGIWKWDVEEKEGELTTLDHVVEEFPVWRRWKEEVHNVSRDRGIVAEELDWDGPEEEESKADIVSA
ncbi:hypothetical protein EDC01DRAFT_711883 [Geopyxis carbonaria]|nr:hypothetical protein EDC01DRAFT_711883 [Geopyxis carbonaria]